MGPNLTHFLPMVEDWLLRVLGQNTEFRGDTPCEPATLCHDPRKSELCRTYWYPVYAYVRRQGHSPEDAQDLSQEFFTGLLAKGFPRGVRPERGRFRSFLLSSLRHFLVDQHRRETAAKRGGGQFLFSLDQEAEERFCLSQHHQLTPERLYEREWAMTLLELVREEVAQTVSDADELNEEARHLIEVMSD